jgi:CheY-like chemotaxis protein
MDNKNPSLSGIKVLVVDDNEDTLALTKLMLNLCGTEVTVSSTAADGLEHGKEMSQAAFLDKYCIRKENDPTCSKVLNAATQNMIDRARNPNEGRMN